MADKAVQVEEVRVLKRGGGAAATFAFLALIIAVVALVMALQAQNKVKQATDQAKIAQSKVSHLQTYIDNSLGSRSTASSGAGAGPNTQQAIPSTNTTPNGNGQ